MINQNQDAIVREYSLCDILWLEFYVNQNPEFLSVSMVSLLPNLLKSLKQFLFCSNVSGVKLCLIQRIVFFFFFIELFNGHGKCLDPHGMLTCIVFGCQEAFAINYFKTEVEHKELKYFSWIVWFARIMYKKVVKSFASSITIWVQ